MQYEQYASALSLFERAAAINPRELTASLQPLITQCAQHVNAGYSN